MLSAPRTDPYVRLSRIRLPPRVSTAAMLPYVSQHPVSRLSGSESSACLIGPHSPWSLPFAPPTPQLAVPLCSSASSLLWQGPTSRVRSSSATAPRLPDAGRQRHHRSGQTRDLPASDTILLHVMWPWTPAGRQHLAWRCRT